MDHERDGGGQGSEESAGERGTGVSIYSITLLVLLIIIVVVLGQNTDDVTIKVLWGELDAPLFIVVILSALVVTAAWEIGTLLLRHRRRKRRAAEADH